MKSAPFITSLPSIEWQNEAMTKLHASPAGSLARTRITRDLVVAFTPYLGGIAKCAWRRYGCPGRMDGLEDVESAARQGLLNAIERWQPGRSKPIIHLAAKWIAGTAKSEACRLANGCVMIPQKVRRLSRYYRTLQAEGSPRFKTFLAKSHSRRSTRDIVRYFAQSECQSSRSLSVPGIHPTAESACLETIGDIARIRDVLRNECTTRQRLVFYLKFPELVITAGDAGEYIRCDGKRVVPSVTLARTIRGNMATIAPIIGVSRERIRQILSELFQRLRHRLDCKR